MKNRIVCWEVRSGIASSDNTHRRPAAGELDGSGCRLCQDRPFDQPAKFLFGDPMPGAGIQPCRFGSGRHGFIFHGQTLEFDDPERALIGFPQLSLLQFHPIPYLPLSMAQPLCRMPALLLRTTFLRLVSNGFMTVVWDAHLKGL